MIDHLGRYEITGELGRGAMGIVYKAYDPLIERTVAIKTINLNKLSETERAEYQARFYLEAKAAGRMNHPNIVTIYDLGESGDEAYIAMELMEGRDLERMVHGHGRLLFTDALHIAIQVASGLFYAHQHGVVHGDIKPSNIMVLGDNLVKIADFGIARLAAEAQPEQAVFGTPAFMSPEQLQGKAIDARSDIFSLGVVLYYMLTDRLPFPAQDDAEVERQILHDEPVKPSAMNPGIPAELDEAILKCLAKTPGARYRNANELANDLRACLSGLLHTHASAAKPVHGHGKLKPLKRVVAPQRFSRQLVAQGSYFAMFTMVALTLIDLVTPDTIHLNLLYIFPLIVITLHCERGRLISMALALALFLQGLNLLHDDIPLSSKLAIALMVVGADIAVVLLTRIARINFLEVEQLSSFDSLTRLRNRLSFEVMADVEIDRHKQKQAAFSFACIDLFNLKALNQKKGYAAGDQAIRLVAQVLRDHQRPLDTPARIGGDEFAILMPNTGAADCAAYCRSLSEQIAQALAAAGLAVSTNTGHATFESAPDSVSALFDAGEAAMHRAKASGTPFAVCD